MSEWNVNSVIEYPMTAVAAIEGMEKVIERLQSQLAEREWISVDDRLPEDGEVVFVYCKENDRLECVPFVGQWPLVIINWETGDSTSPVTHWMPLPTPPTANKEK